MVHINNTLKKNFLSLIIIISFVCLSIISSILLFKSHTLFGAWDMQFHLKRIMELKESVMHNNFFPNFSFNYFHGSSVMNLYPYFNLFPIVFLSFIIKSKITLIYFYFLINVFITLGISYFSCKNYTNSVSTSYIFSIIYSLSNVFLAYNFVSMDFGIVASFMFLPLIIFGFINVLQKNNSYILLSSGMILVALSHILNFIIICIFLFIWLIINYHKISKSIIYNLCKSIIIFIFVTSIMWLPTLQFYIHNFNAINLPASIQLRRLSIKVFITGVYNGVNYDNIGIFGLISIAISILFYKKFNIIIKQMYVLSLIILVVVLLFPKGLTSFKIFSILNKFQFTFRPLIIPQILLSLIFSIIITNYINKKYIKNLIYFLTIFIAIFLQLLGQYKLINNNLNNPNINQYLNSNNNILDLTKVQKYKITNNNQFNNLINANNTNKDYIPKRALNVNPIVNGNIGYNNNYYIRFKRIGYNKISFFNNKNIRSISLPIYLYNGEQLKVYINNQKVDYFSNNNGLLTINNVKNKYNNIYIVSSY